jgi:hypothetical protein
MLCALQDDLCGLDALSLVSVLFFPNALCAQTFQSLALVQLSVENVMREALNARDCELLSSKQ